MSPLHAFRGGKKHPETNYLTLTPFTRISHETGPEGWVVLLVPRFTSRFWKKLLLSRTNKKHIRLNLDELGSATWQLIDGERRVGEICSTLSERFGEKIHPVEERTTRFLSQLYLNKYIGFREIQ